MSAWRVAWRLRGTALAASAVPAGLTVALFLVETHSDLLAIGGDAAYVLFDAAYFAAEALFVGLLLEAMLATGGLPPARLAARPGLGVVLFAAAMAVVGLVAALIQLGVRDLVVNWFMADLTRNPDAEPPLFAIWFEAVVRDPAVQWLLGGLLAPFVALRTLSLPRLRPRPSSWPSVGLVTVVLEAVVLAVLLYRGADAGLAPLGPLGEPLYYVAWYVVALGTLTLIAAGVGLMLMRRAGHPALA